MSPLTLGSRKPRHHTSLPPRPRTSALAGALTTFPCLVCIFFSSCVSRAVCLTMKCARTFPCSRCGASRAGTKTASPWRERPRGREGEGGSKAEIIACVCVHVCLESRANTPSLVYRDGRPHPLATPISFFLFPSSISLPRRTHMILSLGFLILNGHSLTQEMPLRK